MRLIANWVIMTAMILVFNYIGWLHLLDGDGNPVKGVTGIAIGSAAVVAFIYVIAAWALLLGSLGCAAILMFLFGGAALWLAAQLAPGFLATNGFWYTAIAGLLLMLVSMPYQSRSTPEQANEPA